MEQKLTVPEITYIRALASIKTDEELAKMMDKPVELIKLQFSIMANLPKRPEEKPSAIAKLLATSVDIPATSNETTESPKKKRVTHAERKIIRDQKEATEREKRKEKQLAHMQEIEQSKIRKDRLRRGTYATRPIDLSGKVPIKLNAKTVIWAKPGTDIEELKRKYKIA
jgi:hypothetical protein